MKAPLHYVVRNLGRRRTRTVVGALGLFLTLAFLTAIQLGLESVSTSYTDLAALQAGKADVVITAEGGDFARPEPFFDAAVRKALAGNADLIGLAPRLTGMVQATAGAAQQFAVLIAIDPAQERRLDVSGLRPEPELAEGTCAVSRVLARRLKLREGDAIALQSARTAPPVSLRVGALLDRQLLLPQEVRDYVVVNEADGRVLLDEAVPVHALAGALRDSARFYDARDLGASVRRLKDAGEAIAAALGPGYEVRMPKAAAIAAFQNFTAPVRAFFGVFALLALAITALLVYSIISVGVEERIREYGILRTLGGRRRDIVALVLGESLLLCLAGVVPGVLAGAGLARVGVRVVERVWRAGDDAITLHVSPATLGLALAAGVLISIASALVPALQAVRWRIVDALDPFRRGQVPAAPEPGSAGRRPLLLLGCALSALALTVFFVLPPALLSGNPSLIGTVVLCLLITILLGFTLIALGALPALERILTRLFAAPLGPAAELAARNLERHRRRHTTTAILFILSVSGVILIASLAALFSRTSLALVDHANGADVRIQAEAGASGAVKSELARVPGVAAVAEVNFLRGRTRGGVAYDVVMSDLVGLKQLWIVPFGVDADLARALYVERIQFEEGGPEALARLAEFGGGGRAPAPPAEIAPGAGERGDVMIERAQPEPGLAVAAAAEPAPDEIAPLILSLAAARHLEVGRGDLVRLSFRLGAERRERRFRVEAVCGAMPGFENFRGRVAQAVGSGALIPRGSFQALTAASPPEARLTRFFLRAAADSGGGRELAQRIRDGFDVRHRFGVRSTEERREEARKLYWATQVLFGLLLLVAIVIAVFALIASMATAALERRWEIGVLRSLGLRRGQVFRMFLGEAAALALTAGIAGGGIGFGLAYLFVLQAAALIEVPVAFSLPYGAFLATFAASVGAGALAAYVPTRALLRRTPAEILRG